MAAPDETTLPLIINGAELRTSETFPIISPTNGDHLWRCSSASTSDALEAVEAASRAFPSWSQSSAAHRRQIFLRAADLIEARAPELENYMKAETGALDAFARFNTQLSAGLLRDVAGRIATALEGSMPVCDDGNTSAMVVKEPYGVILAIAPWNAPYILGFRSVASAMAVGNTCVLKGSETSPRCHLAIESIFREAGLPAGVLNVLVHRREDAAAITRCLVESPAVAKVNFTGSTAVGSIISEMAGRSLKPVLMELGGKASAIVCNDANLDRAASQCALGAFLHNGQICMSTERILVQSAVRDPFINLLREAVIRVFGQGAPPVAQEAILERNRRLVQDAVGKGASLIHGSLDNGPTKGQGPLIVRNVDSSMEMYHTESFGPSVSLVSFDTDQEAIRIANDTRYGLSGAVFTEDLGRGIRMARQIQTGAVHINSMTVHDEPTLPHGGVKDSGWGRFNAQYGMDEFQRTKTITFQL